METGDKCFPSLITRGQEKMGEVPKRSLINTMRVCNKEKSAFCSWLICCTSHCALSRKVNRNGKRWWCEKVMSGENPLGVAGMACLLALHLRRLPTRWRNQDNLPFQNMGSQSQFTWEAAMTKRKDYKYTPCPMEKKWLLEAAGGGLHQRMLFALPLRAAGSSRGAEGSRASTPKSFHCALKSRKLS